jgi:hypothetical protein
MLPVCGQDWEDQETSRLPPWFPALASLAISEGALLVSITVASHSRFLTSGPKMTLSPVDDFAAVGGKAKATSRTADKSVRPTLLLSFSITYPRPMRHFPAKPRFCPFRWVQRAPAHLAQ